jgi:type II restriction enzyme
MTWHDDVLAIVQKLPSRFSLEDCYRFVPQLARKHPDNDNIEAKIRQQLQALRDEGVIRFVDRNGRYEKA